LIPYKKWAIVFVGLLPMALFQAASLSADVMVEGLLTLFFAYILYLVKHKNKLTWQQLAILLLLAIGMTLTKQVMFIFLPLVLLLPRRQFRSTQYSFLAKIAIIIIPLILFAGWMSRTHSLSITPDVPIGQNTHMQESFILHNPHSYINVLWNTNFFNWSDSITGSFIGNFGWQDTPLAEWLVILGYLSMAFVFLANYSAPRAWLSRRQKNLIISVAVIYWLAVSTALYVYYTPVGFKIIVGLQGRYFIPLALLAIPVVYSSSWLKTSRAAYRRIAVLAPIFLLVCSVITIYVRYYVNNV
jgi:uncharacterized membrane protein